jgi:TolA-binding protein
MDGAGAAKTTTASSMSWLRRRLRGSSRDDPNSKGPDALEAGFYRGLSLLFSGDYPKAEQAFAAWRGFCRWPRWSTMRVSP